MYSGTLPPSRNPKGQPVRSEKRGARGLSGVSGFDVHHERGADWGRIWVWPTLGGKRAKGSTSRFQPIKPMVSRLSNQLSIVLRRGGPTAFDMKPRANPAVACTTFVRPLPVSRFMAKIPEHVWSGVRRLVMYARP